MSDAIELAAAEVRRERALLAEAREVYAVMLREPGAATSVDFERARREVDVRELGEASSLAHYFEVSEREVEARSSANIVDPDAARRRGGR